MNITHKKFDKRSTAQNEGFDHQIIIPWDNQKSYFWNELCADIVEVFGLPGHRFMYHPEMDKMTFFFKSSSDALLCKVMISDKDRYDRF